MFSRPPATADHQQRILMDMKARGNALFRDGDFQGAADEFRRALETAHQVKHNPRLDLFGDPLDLDRRVHRSASTQDTYLRHYIFSKTLNKKSLKT